MQAASEIHNAAKLAIPHFRPEAGTGARSSLYSRLCRMSASITSLLLGSVEAEHTATPAPLAWPAPASGDRSRREAQPKHTARIVQAFIIEHLRRLASLEITGIWE